MFLPSLEIIWSLPVLVVTLVGIYKVMSSNYVQPKLTLLKDLMIYHSRDAILNYLQIGMITTENAIEIKYYLRDTPYIIVIPKPQRGPRNILKIYTRTIVLDELTQSETSFHEIDITDILKLKIGPHGNFHNIATTPKMLGYPGGLSVKYRHQEEHIFYTENDIIIL